MDTSLIYLFAAVAFALIVLVIFVRQKVKELEGNYLKSLENSLAEIATLKTQLETLQNKYKLNPSFDCQAMMAEMLSGTALFRIEKIDTEDVFLRRR